VRRIATELRPSVLELGLLEAIGWEVQQFQTRTGIHCSLRIQNKDVALDDERSTAMYRIFQEALTNISRHAHAKNVTINVRTENNTLMLEIRDDGKGIDMQEIRKLTSLGLLGMKERALMFGGSVDIVGKKGGGTSVKVEIPIRDEPTQEG